jgi:hypothetical protein
LRVTIVTPHRTRAPRQTVAESRHDDVLDLADSDQYFHEDAAPNNHGANPAADLISEPAITSMRDLWPLWP